MPLFEPLLPRVALSPTPLPSVLQRLTRGQNFSPDDNGALTQLLRRHTKPAQTVGAPPMLGMSAGKNTYTYDAHTYHTKVPPQGIAELVKHYLPEGGLILDPFAGSGMTGVACRAHGYDCILNELSPAACFIADRFTSSVDPQLFAVGVARILENTRKLRTELYTTRCRECGDLTELLYMVWSYHVVCQYCEHEFLLWDHCRSYGRRVRDHKILTEFPCPACSRLLRKSRLQRTTTVPVQVGYMCCGSRQQEVVHPPDEADLELVERCKHEPPVAEGFFPQIALPDGVNLRQPKTHGIERIDQFYSPRNLAAMSHLWKTIHRVEDENLAGFLAFVFTSLYQRVTRLAEFRFWGGSGNTARFNVPFIFNEANVFVTFERKARTIQDHLEATATHYRGTAVVIQHSATRLSYLPNESVDLIFTDPPFGANINYSEMNFLWESWLGEFTDTEDEAIINKYQDKGIRKYQTLMTESLRECYRVLREGHWLLLVFMNSSKEVWLALRTAILDAGFDICKVDSFDKQHGTFKHFVSDNTAGHDLVLHCQKSPGGVRTTKQPALESARESVYSFLQHTDIERRISTFLHVDRATDIDYRSLYSEWTAMAILQHDQLLDFAQFRSLVDYWLRWRSDRTEER